VTEAFSIADYVNLEPYMSYNHKEFTRKLLRTEQEMTDYLNIDYQKNDRQIVSVQVSQYQVQIFNQNRIFDSSPMAGIYEGYQF
jgi:tRNA isopentenyl-2-thiomethyl-A-37 hydroxylase MiaE